VIDLQITGNVDKLPGRARDWAKLVQGRLLADVAQLTVHQAKERVRDTKHSPDLQRWAPRKSGGSHPLMLKTRRMINSIRKRRAGAAEFHAGAQVPYAKFHHTGTAQMEPRQFIGVGFHEHRDIEDLIDAFVGTQLR
jgi:phage gpG-like protein